MAGVLIQIETSAGHRMGSSVGETSSRRTASRSARLALDSITFSVTGAVTERSWTLALQ